MNNFLAGMVDSCRIRPQLSAIGGDMCRITRRGVINCVKCIDCLGCYDVIKFALRTDMFLFALVFPAPERRLFYRLS